MDDEKTQIGWSTFTRMQESMRLRLQTPATGFNSDAGSVTDM